MATILKDISRTFGEYLLLPNLTSKKCIPSNVNLVTPIVKYRKGDDAVFSLRIPFTSAIMQAVSDERMAITLAREGGLSFIYCSQPIDAQAKMVAKVKKYKAGFVISDANVLPSSNLEEVMTLREKTGHSTMAVTHNGKSNGKFCGIITSRDYVRTALKNNALVESFMTPSADIFSAKEGISLREANDIISLNKLSVLPILDANEHLSFLVFRKDYDEHVSNPNELLDDCKRLCVGAGINTRDYSERIPELVAAGADVLLYRLF